MDEKDKYYQILGLNPGASEEEIKEAYRDLVTVWHPDRFSNNSRLRHKANEKIMDINIAYENLKSGFARETSTTSDGKSHVRSQPPPHNPPHRSEEKQQTETSDNLHTGSRPPQKEPPGGVRSWLTAAIVGGMAVVILFFFILFLTFYRQPTRATDYTETASAISSSFPLEQPTSTGTANLHCTSQYTSRRSTSPGNREVKGSFGKYPTGKSSKGYYPVHVLLC